MNGKTPVEMNNRIWLPILTTVLLTVASGCGGAGAGEKKTGTVEGTVTMKGKSLEKCRISFYNPDNGSSGGGTIGADGQFKFTDPIAVGTYQVTVLPPEAAQPDNPDAMKEARKLATMIPLGYQDGNNSGLKAEVKEGPNSYKFELNKSGPSRSSSSQTPP